MGQVRSGVKWKLYCFVLVCFLGTSIYQVWHSVTGALNRAIYVVTAVMLIGTAVYWLYRWMGRLMWARIAAAILAILAISWAAFGGSAPNTDALRAEYVRQLGSYKGASFIWGGETSNGMDCSGLVRTAFWRAMLVQGIREHNPRLLGPKLWSFWWRDITAKSILDGEYGYTRVIGSAEQLAGYDTSGLEPGDLAVTGDGAHVMAYFGNGEWIEASPENLKVVSNPAPKDSKRGYFRMDVKLLRWSML